MKKSILFVVMCVIAGLLHAQTTLLPNGWKLSPAGKTINLESDLPLNMAISPNGKYIAVTNNGVGDQTIQLVSAHKRKLLSTIPIAKSWLGLKFSKDGKYLYASGGNDNRILIYRVAKNTLSLADSIVLGEPWPVKISPTGIDIDEARQKLYVVTKENNSLYIVDLASRKTVNIVQLSAEGYTCLLAPDCSQLFISLWGGGQVVKYDIALGKITDSVATGRNTNDMCQTADGKYLFAANAVDNTVSVIDCATFRITEVLSAARYPIASPAASC